MRDDIKKDRRDRSREAITIIPSCIVPFRIIRSYSIIIEESWVKAALIDTE